LLVWLSNMDGSELYMRRALQLARLGQGLVAPNPMVGCVLVHPERGIIGEGWHRAYGGPHAEVWALASVVEREYIPESTAFVSLEPCSHFGKTPPCADLLVAEGVRKVVVCHADPHALVSGRGLKKLEAAGVETETGLMKAEGLDMNRVFIHAQKEKRPWITLKWAMTADGFVAKKANTPAEITQFPARVDVHRQRSLHQAILVGKGTLLSDNPLLNVRLWTGKQPIRLILDPQGNLPVNLNVFQDAGSPTWVLGPRKDLSGPELKIIQGLNFNPYDPKALATWLCEQGINSLYVEGGPKVQNRFLDSGMWDEIHIYQAPLNFGDGVQAPQLPAYARLQSGMKMGDDQFWLYQKL
jgi:diaminohydroxyphosphoribosylaminopyrimidine deaminase/5-amino-6-(5-phosphoribosylamino)uracil reductase